MESVAGMPRNALTTSPAGVLPVKLRWLPLAQEWATIITNIEIKSLITGQAYISKLLFHHFNARNANLFLRRWCFPADLTTFRIQESKGSLATEQAASFELILCA